MSCTASNLLGEVEEDVRRQFSSTTTTNTVHTSSSVSSPAVSPSLLTAEDWAAIVRPMAPDTYPTAGGSMADLHRYVQVRCAELPMRLQMEALQTRRYEHLLRQHMRELVTLSEYVALVSRAPPTLAAPPRSPSDASQQQQQQQLAGAAPLPSDISVLLMPEEVTRRLNRAEERIRELEAMVRLDAVAKVQCCQRMVVLSAYVRTLVRRVGRGAAAGGKRSRSEEQEAERVTTAQSKP